MANLFFVFTPFQFFAAQQIVHSEGLHDNILIEGYVTTNKHFIEIYDFMEIEGMWKEKHVIPDIEHWDGNRIKNLKDARIVYKKYLNIKNIAEKNRVKKVFLGEIQNQTCRFTAVLFAHLGYDIAFFEDGMSHYINRPYIPDNSLKKRVKVLFHDLIYYLPIYHVRFAQWRYNGSKPLNKDFPPFTRYSLIPFHKEEYDIHVKSSPIASQKVQNYINSFVGKDKETDSSILLMTDPLNELIPKSCMSLYYETIKEALKRFGNETVVYIKFHPRDPQKSREKVISIAEELGVQYKVLSEDINLPVEYYLQYIPFKCIFFFNAATFFYNGYVFPKREFVSLLPQLRQKCIDNGIPTSKISGLDNILYRIEKGICTE